MQKLVLSLFVPAAIIGALSVVAVGCDSGSNVTPCETSDDCADLTDTPVCDEDLGQCVADNTECEEDVDCQIKDGSADTECEADDDCDTAGDEVCVTGFDDQGYCVVTGDDTACALVDGFVSVSATKVDGGDVDVCVSEDGTCSDDGACE